jgi:hypothetical protein
LWLVVSIWRSVEVGPGALLVLTDGFTEVFDGKGRMLGQTPIEELLSKEALTVVGDMGGHCHMARAHGL